MKGKLSLNKIIYYLYLLFSLVVFFVVLLNDFSVVNFKFDTFIFRYSFIIINLLFSITNLIISIIKKLDIKEPIILVLIMLFTSISDYFLLLKDSMYEIGLSTFIVVQLLYYYLITYKLEITKEEKIVGIFKRLIIFLILLIIIYFFTDLFNFLNTLVAFYFINLVFNFLDSLSVYIRFKNENKKVSDKYLILSLGFFFFILCDLSIGLDNILGGYMQYCWISYIPSQILLLSIFLKNYFNLGLKNEQIS